MSPRGPLQLPYHVLEEVLPTNHTTKAPISVISTAKLRQLAERWSGVQSAERSNFQLYLTELTDALGAERPRPAGAGYCFEHPVRVVSRDGSESTNFIDLYKQGHFVLEAKDQERDEGDSTLLRRAFGQALSYAVALEGSRPPYLLVLDVGKSLIVWDRWSGSYGGFNAGRRIALANLAEPQRRADAELIRDIFEDPAARDPRAHAAAVTREVAGKLAALATTLEQRGHSPEDVASFLIRCVFTMFAEDIGLLPGDPFQTAVAEIGLSDPGEFEVAVRELWQAMDTGQRFGLRKLLRFNGHFFRDPGTLPLTREDMVALHEASMADWASVEPSIFGTLLTRALDPEERHRLGAEFTPRAFVERVVRPTIEAPVRERWTLVQAEALQLHQTGKRKDREKALSRLRHFHEWLRSLRILDPACGSGNFLYVALNTLKRVEFELLRMIEEISGQPELAVEEVGPWQFHGIEIKPWAREVAELCLWAGHFQAWRELHGHAQPPEPVLRDTGALECRDAVLAWDTIVEDALRVRQDPTPRIRHQVTGELVPDPAATLPYMEHIGVRQARWPEAEFIVGNPPYMGRGRQREAFGDGYVDALRAAYPDVPDNADYVMYWWHRAAAEIAAGRALRAGLITTNTIRQRHNRAVIQAAQNRGAHVIWAVPDHPWIDEAGSAAVRVSMTVLSAGAEESARIVQVGEDGSVESEAIVGVISADLTGAPDVVRAAGEPLLSNKGVCQQGFTLVGEGFRLSKDEGESLIAMDPSHADIVRPLRAGRDIGRVPRGLYTIDFGLMSEEEAQAYPVLYDIVRDRVKPQRDGQRRAQRKRYWWRYGEPTVGLREALAGLDRFIVTVETAKHRIFRFLPTGVAAEHSVVCVAVDDAFALGVLSSNIHVTWALAAGGRLGVGNDPRYQKVMCFDPFPFPAAGDDVTERVRQLAERLEAHREQAIARGATITGMYNILEKLTEGAQLTPAERDVHETAACGTLRDLHHKLDAAVAAVYRWSWPLSEEQILMQLVALHDERREEENAGHVRWLRPAFQRQRFIRVTAETVLELEAEMEAVGTDGPRLDWPPAAVDQIRAVQESLAAGERTVEEIASRYRNARRELVQRHLETLVMLGEARIDGAGGYDVLPESA